jgi:nuclear protein localization family protein 4
VPAAGAFPIENRQGLHDQSMNAIFPRLNPILSKFSDQAFDPDESAMLSAHKDKGKGRETDAGAVQELANFLSDWHLLAFLDTCGIFALDDMKLIARIAAKKDTADVKKLLRSPAWKTLVTIAQEHAGESFSDILWWRAPAKRALLQTQTRPN